MLKDILNLIAIIFYTINNILCIFIGRSIAYHIHDFKLIKSRYKHVERSFIRKFLKSLIFLMIILYIFLFCFFLIINIFRFIGSFILIELLGTNFVLIIIPHIVIVISFLYFYLKSRGKNEPMTLHGKIVMKILK